MQEIYYPSSDGISNVHACIWAAEGECKAVLQIIHGMAEYAARYAPFAEKLTKLGITVCAEDHLGHGKTAKTKDDLGYFARNKGYAPVLSDIAALTEIMRAKYSGVPYFVLGHSMGSFFCRKYITIFGKELAGAIIMGTGFMGGALTGTAKLATSAVAAFKGWKHRSKLINNLAFGSYNKRFEGRTEYDWLSANQENVDRYIVDELCGVPFTCNAFYGLFSIITEACKSSTIKATPSELPILLLSGKDDPVGGYGKGVIKLYDKLSKCNKNVSMTLYEGFRHEILNDDCALLVEEDIVDFITSLI
ncbi:MAG: alpha/beta fold hydrolase [Candidatus Coproplasma sp.]